jgi:hypothetical protein
MAANVLGSFFKVLLPGRIALDVPLLRALQREVQAQQR